MNGKVYGFPILIFSEFCIMKYLIFFLATLPLLAQKKMKPEMTEVWEPIPAMVDPGNLSTPPSDAIVLFDGTDLSQWTSAATGGNAEWILNGDGSMTVKRGSGIETKKEFGSVQLHIEWRTPSEVKGKGQGRGNSGVFTLGSKG